MSTEKIINILYKRLAGTDLNAGERQLLDDWIAENPETRREMMEVLSDPERLAEGYRIRSMIPTERVRSDMERRLGLPATDVALRPRSFLRRYLRHMGAAAAILLILGIGIVYLFNRNVTMTPGAEMATNGRPAPLRLENLVPGGSQAIVTTPAGDTIRLSSPVESGALLARNKSEGALQIDVPRGGEFMVVLEDSTRVWLNSASRLTYPAHFAADCRKVEITGEAYFSVTHDSDHPFIVETSGQRVKVYGTEFNIRAYPEDPAVYTTLSSGSISLTPLAGGGELFLSPGKQSIFNKSTSEATVRPIDIERVTGWRHGRFVFEEQSLRQIMRDLSRWYDFDYEFADEEAAETIFMGSIPRYSNFKTAIAILEKSGGLSFNVRDEKIVISRQPQ